MHDLARFAGLDDDARSGAPARTHETPVDRGHRQQGGDGHGALGQVAVAQDEDPRAPGDRRLGVAAESFKRSGKIPAVAARRESHG